VASFAIRPLNTRLVASGVNPVIAAFSSFLPMAAFAMVQALLLILVLQFGLQLQIDSVAQFYAFGLLAAVVFAAIIQLLMAAFGFSGRFIAIILLMLQLTSSAGTFPIETAPLFFQIVHPLMPMTYVVDGMRQLTTGVGFDIALQSAAVLLVFGLAALALTSFVAWRKRMVKMEDLYPLITIPSV
jgi:putative membrane protein